MPKPLYLGDYGSDQQLLSLLFLNALLIGATNYTLINDNCELSFWQTQND